MQVDLLLPSRKRFTKTFALYGPIDPAKSSYTIFGTKSEISLAKADGRSWPSITALDPALARNFVAQLAFSAGSHSPFYSRVGLELTSCCRRRWTRNDGVEGDGS